MGQFHWDPGSYLELMRAEVPAYEQLQDQTAQATGYGATRILELGTGTGETARRVLERHPPASFVGLDASAEMLSRARTVLTGERVSLQEGRLEEPLPPGPFELVISTLTIHHLGAPAKADLFKRIAAVLVPGGRLVVGDLVVPENPADVVTPIDGDYDLPSTLAEQLKWLDRAGFRAWTSWADRDLVVMVADLRPCSQARRSR